MWKYEYQKELKIIEKTFIKYSLIHENILENQAN